MKCLIDKNSLNFNVLTNSKDDKKNYEKLIKAYVQRFDRSAVLLFPRF